MLTEPIVEGAYYEREDGVVVGPNPIFQGGGVWFDGDTFPYELYGIHTMNPRKNLTRRVYIVPTDPADVVAELRDRKMDFDRAYDDGDVAQRRAFDHALDLVAEKLGVGNG